MTNTEERVPNSDQEKVIDELDHNIILYASAGTGKTFTVAKRVSRIISSGRALPEEILCLTFTVKAADEMQEDILEYSGPDAKEVNVNTIHGFCYQLVREESKREGDLYTDPSVCDENDAKDHAETILKAMGLPESSAVFRARSVVNNFVGCIKHQRETRNIISSNEANDYQQTLSLLQKDDPRTYEKILTFYDPVAKRETEDPHFTSLMLKACGEFIFRYNEFLRQSNLLDFDDLICLAHRYLRDENRKSFWQSRYKYIIVDEMQDTSELEYDIIRHLVGDGNIMMCGDYFQTIYEWRGSNPDKILTDFTNEFRARRFMFAQNYRSTQLLTQATFGYLKNTYPDQVGTYCPPDIVTKAPDPGEKIQNVRLENPDVEAQWIYSYLEKAAITDPTRVCVMSRTNRYIAELYSRLSKISLTAPSHLRFFSVDQDTKFFRRAVVKDIMAFYNVLLNQSDSLSLARIGEKYARGIGKETISKLYRSGSVGLSPASMLEQDTYDFGDPYETLIQAFAASNVVIYDTETTGLDLAKDQMIQLSAVRLDASGNVIDTLDQMILPTVPISAGATRTHHQTMETIIAQGGIPARDALEKFSAFVKGAVLVGHNSLCFDSPLVRRQLFECGLPPLDILGEYDTLPISKQFLPKSENYKLDTLCQHFGITNQCAHNALGDITATGEVLTRLIQENIVPTTEYRKALVASLAPKFEKFDLFLKELQTALSKNDITGIFDTVVEKCNLKKKYNTETDQISLDDLRHALASLDTSFAEASLREFATDAALSGSQIDMLIKKLKKIPIITVHQSKGCEFDQVIIAGADSNNFPSFASVKGGNEPEEKRVFYVAISRAKQKLILTSTQVNDRGYQVYPSPYIANIPGKYVENRGK